ncbi:hypothetical protein WEN_00135 [Mycoplasma wenyonii str. Massachusetts]|uniref:Uncharacterized protein n=1 Tax=Mycoplasma wenyonii (strain Massachusetts) TaxID=1197325 RepID=I6YA69_MYCWM|nr:hypothetical protein [Mycoplasma wenyonii]AFN64836.1 hypothetical protein WEN_00135 [Mycoplasma wenyonii str. Massachusetts]
MAEKVTGRWWEEARVGPWFSGWRMREGAAKAIGTMSYSYGYVARVKGSETARNENRTVENKTTEVGTLLDGELTLIETKWGGNSKGKLITHKDKEGIVGGFTKKKFILIGTGEDQQIEFQGLVSIVEGDSNSSQECLQQVKESDLESGAGNKVMASMKEVFGDSGLFQDPKKTLSMAGRFIFGNCNDQFYKDKRERSSKITVVEELKSGAQGARVGFQEIKVPDGMSIAVGVGIKKQTGEPKDIIAPGILVKNKFTDGRTLWAGLQGDGKVIKTDTKKQDKGQGTVVLHDWISTNSSYKDGDLWKDENSKGTKEGFAKKISLNEKWHWYLWDLHFSLVVINIGYSSRISRRE